MTVNPSDDWPDDVEEIRIADLKRLGINKTRQLFWDGRQIEVRRPLVLTAFQKTFAILVTIFAVLGGLGAFFSGVTDASQFLCARNIHWLSCPVLPAAKTE